MDDLNPLPPPHTQAPLLQLIHVQLFNDDFSVYAPPLAMTNYYLLLLAIAFWQ